MKSFMEKILLATAIVISCVVFAQATDDTDDTDVTDVFWSVPDNYTAEIRRAIN